MNPLSDVSQSWPATVFFAGVASTAFAASAIFFFKFWKRSREAFFLYFGLSCLMLAVDRAKILWFDPSEETGIFHLARLGAFLLIIIAVVKANVPKSQA